MSAGKMLDITEQLNRLWHAICRTYGVASQQPDLSLLLEDVDLSVPHDAAITVLVNMLSEAVECVGRFSPYYKLPARDFGMVSCRDNDNHLCWTLTPEALCLWASVLTALEITIRKNMGVLLASQWIASIEDDQEDDCVLASCGCSPPHLIVIESKALNQRSVICQSCQEPYHLISAPSDDEYGNVGET